MKAIRIAHSFDTILTLSLLGVALFALFAYVTLTAATIFATASRTSAVKQSSILMSQISTLEERYLSLQDRITPEEAHTLGLVQPKNVTFTTQAGSGIALSFGR